jgi:carbon starvation protein
MARIFSGLPGMNALLAYWYHFAVMFEALFILTTIDTGTRIGRFLMQEFLGRIEPKWGRSTSKVGGITSTLLIVVGWTYFILTGNISTIWPMFGIANQLLACTALCVATTILLRESARRAYAIVTLFPLAFVSVTTITAGVESIFTLYLPMTHEGATRVTGFVNSIVTSALLAMIAMILMGSVRRWLAILRTPERTRTAAPYPGGLEGGTGSA